MTDTKAACIICEMSDTTVLYRIGGYSVLKCMCCGLVYVTPLPAKDSLLNAYGEDYYKPWATEQRKARVKMWRKRLKTLNILCGDKRGHLLDVGCAEGLFLEMARADGWDVTGTEISNAAAEYTEKCGLKIFQGELTEAGFPDKTFDAVTMWHVLEHTTWPLTVLKEIRRILKDNSILIMAIPNLYNPLSQLIYRLIKGKKMHLFDPTDRELHLYHFTPETIQLALKKTGFSVCRIMSDMGIVQWRLRMLNCIAKMAGLVTGQIITDAIEVHAKKSL